MNIEVWPICVLLFLSVSFRVCAAPGVTKAGDSLVDPQALTLSGKYGPAINGKSFQQEAVVSHKGYQYVAYYDAKRHACLARRKLPAGKWKIMRFMDYKFESTDAHNTISIGICPKDGTIHMAFDHHSHPLHYRVSQKGVAAKPGAVTWNTERFGPIVSELEKGKPIVITYPRFWQTPDGGLQFCYRRGGSGRGDRMLVDYKPETGAWKNTRQIDSREGQFGESNSRCSYPNGYTYGPEGRLHTTWVWRERKPKRNHDLMYAYSEDKGMTWHNNRGVKLKGPADINSPNMTVAKIDYKYGLMNTHGQAVDSKARIHVVMWHCTDESFEATGTRPGGWGKAKARRNHHYWRDRKGDWRHNELPGVAGNRPKLFIDKNDNVYVIFRDNGSFRKSGDLVITAASAGSKWKNWKVIHKEKGPFVNEMLGDPYRWKAEGILSVMVLETPEKPHDATPLRILDFTFR